MMTTMPMLAPPAVPPVPALPAQPPEPANRRREEGVIYFP